MREYVAIHLKQNLSANKKYCADFYLIPAKGTKYASDDFGVYFGIGNQYYIANYNITSVTPQLTLLSGTFISDTSNWYHYNGIYTALGGESDIVIGSFKDDSQIAIQIIDTSINAQKGAYIIIDDVSLHEMSINIGNDITICTGTNLTIGEQNLDTAFNGYYWYHNGVLFDSIVSQKTITFSQPDSFVVEKRFACGSVWDTIHVNVSYDACFVKGLTINESNIFTPNNDGVNDVFEIKLNGSKYLVKQFEIKNRWGLTVYEQNTDMLKATNISDVQNSNKTTLLQWDGRTTSGVAVTDGVYYYILEVENENGELIKKNGYLTLIR